MPERNQIIDDLRGICMLGIISGSTSVLLS